MKITNQEELDELITTADKSDTIVLEEDLEITFDCVIPYNIKAHNIDARNIDTGNIDAWNIKADNIKARNIDAVNIYTYNIKAHESFKCKSISGRRENYLHKCLDQDIKIVK